MPPVILDFNPHHARLNVTAGTIGLRDGYRTRVDAYWRKVSAGGRFFNGPVLAATGMRIVDGIPAIDVLLTDYAHYLYARQDPDKAFDCQAVYTAAVVVTADDHLLLGEMARHTSAPGQIQCPGGNLEMAPDGRIDPAACCLREVEEELGPALASEVRWQRPLCVKRGGENGTIGLMYLLRLECDASRALAMFEAYRAHQAGVGARPELDRLAAVKLNMRDVGRFLREPENPHVDYLVPLLSQFDRIAAELEKSPIHVPGGL